MKNQYLQISLAVVAVCIAESGSSAADLSQPVKLALSRAGDNRNQIQQAFAETNSSQAAVESLEEHLAADLSKRAPLAKQEFAAVPLARMNAARAEQLLWQDRVARIRKDRAAEMKARELSEGDLKMPFFHKIFGKKPKDGRSMYISLHGGGTTQRVNDRQWENQNKSITITSKGDLLFKGHATRTIAVLARCLDERADPKSDFSAELTVDLRKKNKRTPSTAAASNWPQFRGAQSLGVSANTNLPDTWSTTKNVLWKKDLPGRGWSSPIVWGDRVFLTTVINQGKSEKPKKGLYFGGNRFKPPSTIHQWKTLCLNLNSGKLLWEKLCHKGAPKAALHIKNSYASETPVTDGERVYVYFGNVGLFCYDMGGKPVWSKRLTPHKTRFSWGTASSPVLHKDRLYIVNDNDEDSYLAAFDKRTGKEMWRIKRDEKSNWATPFIWENKLRTEIITPGTGKARSYNLDGKLLYEFGGLSSITIATPYSRFGLLYVSSGYVLDRKKPIFAIRPGASGDITLAANKTANKHIAWCQKTAGPYNPSTIIYDDLLYVLLDRGFITCYDAKTGAPVYGKQRIPNGRAFTSSPWAFNDKVFCLNEDGVTFVVRAGREFKMLQTNKLAEDDMCMATPAIAGDKLLIRTAARIYCMRRS